MFLLGRRKFLVVEFLVIADAAEGAALDVDVHQLLGVWDGAHGRGDDGWSGGTGSDLDGGGDDIEDLRGRGVGGVADDVGDEIGGRIGTETVDSGLDERRGDGIGVRAAGAEDKIDKTAGVRRIAGGGELYADLEGGGGVLVKGVLGTESLLELGGSIRGTGMKREEGSLDTGETNGSQEVGPGAHTFVISSKIGALQKCLFLRLYAGWPIVAAFETLP